ncbi:hypothetical protein DFH06DRAFT_1328833 [Mycena polygramma]|nr:hypothetical protein DFH06DRAFT_1328833 [Mycena polygramma]
MSLSSPQPPPLDNTLGAVFIGLVLSCMLFGVSSLQVYYYYHYYPHDNRLHKASVGILWILDAIHISLIIHASYHYGIRGFGQFAGLLVVYQGEHAPYIPPRLTKSHAAGNRYQCVVIILMVQSLYAYRVWLLGGYHRGVLGYLVVAVVLGGFGIGIALAYETYTVNNFSDLGRITWVSEASFAASTGIDVFIAVAMCYYLRKSKGIENRLNSRLSMLMQYTLSSGVLTSACSAACLFTPSEQLITMPNNLIFLALTYLLIRLYVNSFTAMMNARQRVQRHDDSTFVLSNHVSSNGGTTALRSATMRDPESGYQQHTQDKADWGDPGASFGAAHVAMAMDREGLYSAHGRPHDAHLRQ